MVAVTKGHTPTLAVMHDQGGLVVRRFDPDRPPLDVNDAVPHRDRSIVQSQIASGMSSDEKSISIDCHG
jgi:hypothetical protein